MDNETIVGGYAFGDHLNLEEFSANGVSQVETELSPDDNQYTIRFYGRDGELIQEQRVPAVWTEAETFDVETGQVGELPRLVFDGDGLSYYGDNGDYLWRADGVGVTTQSTSSNQYHMAGRNLNIQDIFGFYDTDTRIDDDRRYGNPYVRRYTEEEMRESAEDYLRMTHGSRAEQRDNFIRMRSRHFDEMFLKGEWNTHENDEQPDIQAERGGALDEFLEEFKPHNTTPERSDE